MAASITIMVRRDRNHPCVISYSIGNEIHERDGRARGYQWAAKLAAAIRKYDATRLVTSGICCLWDQQEVKSNPYVIGDFTWIAYDNLGEAGTGRSIHGDSL